MISLALGVLLLLGSDDPVRVGGGVEMPARVHHVEPVYPWQAGKIRPPMMGMVILEIVLDEGRPVDIQVLEGGPLLDLAAIEAVKQWRFAPTRVGDKPVRVVFREVVDVFPGAEARRVYFERMAGDGRQSKVHRLIAIDRLRSIGIEKGFARKVLQKAAEDSDVAIRAAARRALQTPGASSTTE